MTNFEWQDGQTGFVNVGGFQLEYATHGPPPEQQPTIILLHEGLGSLSLWRDFPEKLMAATGLGVFVYSRAGYGQSDACPLPRPVDYMSREALDVLPVLLNIIGLRRGVLLGHSDGASIAAIHGGLSGDMRVRGLILMAPHFFTEPTGLAAIEQARQAFEHGDLRQKLNRHHRDVDCAFRGWNDAWLDPDFRTWTIADVIDYWRVPVLAIQGTGDAYGTVAQIDEMEARSYAPVERVMFDDCGHSPHRDRPDETLEAIAGFVQRLMHIEAVEAHPASPSIPS